MPSLLNPDGTINQAAYDAEYKRRMTQAEKRKREVEAQITQAPPPVNAPRASGPEYVETVRNALGNQAAGYVASGYNPAYSPAKGARAAPPPPVAATPPPPVAAPLPAATTAPGGLPSGLAQGLIAAIQALANTATQPTQVDPQLMQLFTEFQQATRQPFSFDPAQSASVRALETLAGQQFQEGSQNILNELARRGIMQGTPSADALSLLRGQLDQAVLSAIPAIEQQAFSQYMAEQDRLAQTVDLLSGLLGQGAAMRSSATGDLAQLVSGLLGGLQFTEGQRQFNQMLPIQEAGVTGTYLPAATQELLSAILGLKQTAEANPASVAGLTEQADILRNQLAAQGVDPSIVGANVPAAQAARNIGSLIGSPTFQARQAAEAIALQQWQTNQELLNALQRANISAGVSREQMGLQRELAAADRSLEEQRLGLEERRLDIANVLNQMQLSTTEGETFARATEWVDQKLFEGSMTPAEIARQIDNERLAGTLTDEQARRLKQRVDIFTNTPALQGR